MKLMISFVFFVVAAVYVTEGAIIKMEISHRDKRATDFDRYYDTDGRFYRTDYGSTGDRGFFRTSDDYTAGTYTPYAARFTDYTPTTGFGDYYRGTYADDGRAERRFDETDDGYRGTDGRFYFRDRTFF